jgi:hypothetical protein
LVKLAGDSFPENTEMKHAEENTLSLTTILITVAIVISTPVVYWLLITGSDGTKRIVHFGLPLLFCVGLFCWWRVYSKDHGPVFSILNLSLFTAVVGIGLVKSLYAALAISLIMLFNAFFALHRQSRHNTVCCWLQIVSGLVVALHVGQHIFQLVFSK